MARRSLAASLDRIAELAQSLAPVLEDAADFNVGRLPEVDLAGTPAAREASGNNSLNLAKASE